MKYTELVSEVVKETGLQRPDAALALRVAFKAIRNILLTGEEVYIPVFGTFYLKVSKPKENWTHPATGKVIDRKERVKLRIRASRRFEYDLTQVLLHNKTIEEVEADRIERRKRGNADDQED